jgi:hypothetical protein
MKYLTTIKIFVVTLILFLTTGINAENQSIIPPKPEKEKLVNDFAIKL